jgi:signal transduction histidine kinase
MRAVPRPIPGAHRVAPLEAFSRTERIIAFCRVLLAIATLLVVIVDPKQPTLRADITYLVLSGFLTYSVVLFFLVRGEYLQQEHLDFYSTAADIAWVTVITRYTEGVTGTFFLLHVFVISSCSVRWGLRATMVTTIILAALYPSFMLMVGLGTGADDVAFRRAHLFRPVYLLVLGYLIGYLGEHERRSRRKLAFMLDLPAAFRRSRTPARGLGRLMRRALDHFEAEHGLVILRDPETGRYFTWDTVQRGRRVRLGLRITGENPLPLAFAAPTEGFIANDLRPTARTAICYDVLTGATTRRAIPATLALPGAAQTLMVAPVLIQDQLRGHVLVIREVRRKFVREDLEFLLLLVGQASAGFENVRLQEKAEDLAVLEERGRIARDLHDGFIQSLAGIDLRIEACKMLLQRDPSRLRRELSELHEAVDRGYREVRHYLTVLRQARRPTDDLWATLDRLVEEFSLRERLRVHLTRPSTDPGLASTASFEVTQIVREALRNAVRHGGATQAVVKVGSRPSHLYLVVRDNGAGFPKNHGQVDEDGFLAQAATPWSIRERTTVLGGSLRVWTRPGRGAEVSVIIPAGVIIGRHGSDRRMYA